MLDDTILPNTTEMWIESEKKSDLSCEMSGGNVCVKYSFYYNKAGKFLIRVFLAEQIM